MFSMRVRQTSDTRTPACVETETRWGTGGPSQTPPSLLHALSALGALGALGVHQGAEALAPRDQILLLDWPELERALPDGGLPRGVVELAAPHAHGGGTTLALATCRAAQRDPQAHCAWLEAASGPRLYAPEVRAAGVDLARLLVVRAPREALSRVCVKVLATGAFPLVVVAPSRARRASEAGEREVSLDERAVRRFSLAAEESAARVLLLTDTYASHAPWPVALRLELERLPEAVHVRVARDRRGRVGAARTVPLRTRPHAQSRVEAARRDTSARIVTSSAAPRVREAG